MFTKIFSRGKNKLKDGTVKVFIHESILNLSAVKSWQGFFLHLCSPHRAIRDGYHLSDISVNLNTFQKQLDRMICTTQSLTDLLTDSQFESVSIMVLILDGNS